MPMKTYTLASSHDEPRTRKGHIITFDRQGQPAVVVALYKAKGGYAADHPRSGYALSAFDQLCRFGPPVSLREAKDSLVMMLDELRGYG